MTDEIAEHLGRPDLSAYLNGKCVMPITSVVKISFFCKLFVIYTFVVILAGCVTNNEERVDDETSLPNLAVTQTHVIDLEERNGVEQVQGTETKIEIASVETSSSSFSDILDPLFVLDNNLNTGWASSSETHSASITFVFPDPVIVTRIRIYISSARREQIKQITLHYKDDRRQEITLDSIEGWQEFTLRPEVYAQLELTMSDVQDEHRFTNVFIPEIEIFGIK